MRIKRKISFLAMLFVMMAAAGCSAVDEPLLGPTSPLTSSHLQAAATDRLEAATERDQNEPPTVNVAVSHEKESLTLVSSPSPPSRSLRTLEASEDLNAILDSSSGVVLLDFYADWCGPCRKQSVLLHELEPFASEVNAQIIKVNVDDHQELANRFQVSSLPTLLAVKDGSVLQKNIGLTSRKQIKEMLR